MEYVNFATEARLSTLHQIFILMYLVRFRKMNKFKYFINKHVVRNDSIANLAEDLIEIVRIYFFSSLNLWKNHNI